MKESLNENGFRLYSVMSEVSEQYVREALDDELAENIRAKNRRRRIQMRSGFAACAAVLVLVIGISLLPDRKLERSSDNAAKGADRAGTEIVVSQDDHAKSVQQEAADDDMEGSFAGTGGFSGKTDEAEEAAEQDAQTPEAAETDGAADAVWDNDETALAGDQETMSVKPTFAADDGTVYRLECQSSELHKGKYSGASTEQGIALYSFDNFPARAIALAEVNGGFEVVVNQEYTCETFEQMFRDFGFRYYLHSERVGAAGKAIETYDDYDFQSEVWGLLFEDPSVCKIVDIDELPQSAKNNDLTFYLRLGTEDETYCGEMQISLNKEGYMYVSTGGGSLLCFTNGKAAEIISLFA